VEYGNATRLNLLQHQIRYLLNRHPSKPAGGRNVIGPAVGTFVRSLREGPVVAVAIAHHVDDPLFGENLLHRDRHSALGGPEPLDFRSKIVGRTSSCGRPVTPTTTRIPFVIHRRKDLPLQEPIRFEQLPTKVLLGEVALVAGNVLPQVIAQFVPPTHHQVRIVRSRVVGADEERGLGIVVSLQQIADRLDHRLFPRGMLLSAQSVVYRQGNAPLPLLRFRLGCMVS
jgi:hypothetical protein